MSEREYVKVGYVLRVMHDGGMFAGEYLRFGSAGTLVVESDVALADVFGSEATAREARDHSVDPSRLLIDTVPAS